MKSHEKPANELARAYHEQVLLKYFIYVMGPEQRRQLMDLHPTSYDVVVRGNR